MNDDPAPARRWPLAVFRTVATCQAVLALGQAALAGSFLSGHYGALDLHALNANVTALTALALLVAGLLLRRYGGGASWPTWISGLLFLAEGGQIVVGYRRILALHIPLGVTIIAGIALLLVWAWQPARTQAVTA